jgi:hypothetical protein
VQGVGGAPQVADPLGGGQCLLGVALRIAEAPEHAVQARAAAQAVDRVDAVAHGPGDGQRILERTQADLGVRVCLDPAHLEQSPGPGPVVAQLPAEVDQGLPVGQRCRDVMEHGQRSRPIIQLGPAGGADVAGQELPAQAQAFGEQRTYVEELADVEQ